MQGEIIKFKEIIENQKGLFTVLLTLGIHKILNPHQDIRKHQVAITGGFSGRTIDTKYITPTLMELGLPSMRESGWLTRSLEQPHPYDKNYPGKIQTGKENFLNLVDFIETESKYSKDIVSSILLLLEEIKIKNAIKLIPLVNPEKLSLENIFSGLELLLNKDYSVSGGSKIPVLIFYSALKILCNEIDRYRDFNLKELGSHLSADTRSNSSGDIEIFKDDKLVESYEIKFDVEITSHILNRAKEKIYKHNPERYFILSSRVSNNDKKDINEIIKNIRNDHGCQIFIDSPIKIIKHYLFLLSKLDRFIQELSKNIINDKELKIEHKKEWEKIYNSL